MGKFEMNYFYRNQANQYDVIQIPRILVTDDAYSTLPMQAKILYGLLLDRMNMSTKNKWMDSEGKVYIIYPVREIEEDLKISKRKAVDYLNELENIGLIQKKQVGGGIPNQIYVKKFLPTESVVI